MEKKHIDFKFVFKSTYLLHNKRFNNKTIKINLCLDNFQVENICRYYSITIIFILVKEYVLTLTLGKTKNFLIFLQGHRTKKTNLM